MKICTHCERYVKSVETACPFCQAVAFLPMAPARAPEGRSRAHAFAARSVLATATISALSACSGDVETEKVWDGGDAMTTGGTSSTGGASPAGGALVASGGAIPATGGTNTGGDINLGGQLGELGGEGGGGDILIYGGPFPDMVRARV